MLNPGNNLALVCLTLCLLAASPCKVSAQSNAALDSAPDAAPLGDGHFCRHYSPTGELLAHAAAPGAQGGPDSNLEGADGCDQKAVDLVLGADPQAFHHPEPWNESGREDGPPRALAGSCFAVSVVQPFDGKMAEVGDPVSCKLATDLRVRGVVVAHRGAMVNGHIASVVKQRNELKADVSMKRWGHSGAAVGLIFTEFARADGKSLPLDAAPAAGSHVLSATGSDVLMVVDKEGNITGSMAPAVKGDAVSLAVTGASLAAGPIGLAFSPFANAVVGAVKPEYELHRGVNAEDRHPRLKGFAEGLVNGLPGAFLWGGAARKGDPVDVLPGYQLLLELKKDLPAP